MEQERTGVYKALAALVAAQPVLVVAMTSRPLVTWCFKLSGIPDAQHLALLRVASLKMGVGAALFYALFNIDVLIPGLRKTALPEALRRERSRIHGVWFLGGATIGSCAWAVQCALDGDMLKGLVSLMTGSMLLCSAAMVI